jgi:hypothetical protein
MYQFSLDMKDYLPEDLLLQYEEEDIKGKLERCEPLVLTPLAVDRGNGHHPRCHLGGWWKELRVFIKF